MALHFPMLSCAAVVDVVQTALTRRRRAEAITMSDTIAFLRRQPVHFLLIYDLAPDYLERRGAFRNEHLRLAWEAQERGEIVIAGALADPADKAVLLFSGESSDAAERFAHVDPYVVHGLVTQWHVRPWITVVGQDASTPVRPT
jgi:uncharacterized protein YciI